jgi:hypothetical protein
MQVCLAVVASTRVHATGYNIIGNRCSNQYFTMFAGTLARSSVLYEQKHVSNSHLGYV